MTLADLLQEAKVGSNAAEKCIFDLLYPRMMALCRRYVKVEEDAEEIMLDGFCKFFKSQATFSYSNDASVYSFIKKIMVNECLMFLRKKLAFTLISTVEAADIALDEDALDRLSSIEIFALIIELPVGYRTVFNLFVIEGHTHREISVLLNISEGTSKSQLSKAKHLLQKMLTQKRNYAKQNN